MSSARLPEEIYYKLLDTVERIPTLTQRELAHELGVSLGKVNYCIRAVITRGWLKVGNFQNSRHKSAYMYYLTPSGIDEKARLAYLFLAQKLEEVDALRAEVDRLRLQRRAAPDAPPEDRGSE